MASVWLRALGAVAPGLAIRHLQKQNILRHYMAASKSGPNKSWIPTSKTADNILAMDRTLIVARARDLVRNSSHVAGAIQKIVNNTVFTGIHPQAQIREKNTGTLLSNQADLLETQWEAWASVVDYYGLQRLALRHLLVDGEVLALMSIDDSLKESGVCPLRVELLEAEYLDETQDRESIQGQNRIKGGIEFNSRGIPIAYYIRNQHPGDVGIYQADSRRISAEWVIHLYEPERASQSRGTSRLAPVVMEMRDFAEYQSSERIAARLAAAFGVFVESPYPEHQYTNPVMGDTESELSDAIPKYLESGRIDVLPPGMKISVAENKRPGSNYDAFSRTSLRGASAGTGLSYETFSNDYSTATYSSARAATLEERRGYRVLQSILNAKMNGPVWRAWCKYLNASALYPVPESVPVQWQSPGWPWVDPAKDAKAAELELSLGITTRRKLAAERGMDWDEIIQELAAEQAKIDELGLNIPLNGGNANETTDPDQGDDGPPVDKQ